MTVDLAGPLEGVRYERAGHVATITLDRVDRGNSLTPRMQPIFRQLLAYTATLLNPEHEPEVLVGLAGSYGQF